MSNIMELIYNRQFTGIDLFYSFMAGACIFSLLVSWAYVRAISYLNSLRKLLGQLQDSAVENEKFIEHLEPAVNVRFAMRKIAKRIARKNRN